MYSLWTAVATTMFQRLKLFKDLLGLYLNRRQARELLEQVQASNLSDEPAAVAGRLEQIIRTCLWLVFALQETKITVKRLRSLLFGKSFKASPAPEDASESSQTSGDE